MSTAELSPNWLPALQRIFADCHERALRYFVSKGWLQPGQDFESLPVDTVQRILSMEQAARRSVAQFQTPEEVEAAKKAEVAKRLQARLDRMLERFSSIRPIEFFGMSEEDAPRPKQFRFCNQFFKGESLELDDEGKHGLILAGDTGTGKTAAAWTMLHAAIKEHYCDDFEFVKSVEFFRRAKAKHLSRESLELFTRLFERMLETELLILDDLGSELISQGSTETVFELIDTRTEAWRFTVITTNCSNAELGKAFGKNAGKILRRLKQFFITVDFNKP